MTVLDTIIELLGKHPKGMLSREIAEALRQKDASFASKYLDRGFAKGVVCKIHEGRRDKNGGGRTMRYFLPQHAETAVKENAAQIRRLAQEVKEAEKAREKARRKRAQESRREHEDEAKNYFTHTIIPASQTKAPKAGPRWVFDLAPSR